MWLSTAYQRDSGYIAVHQYHRMDGRAYFPPSSRSWPSTAAGRTGASCTRLDATRLSELYPRFADFQRCATSSIRIACSPTTTRPRSSARREVRMTSESAGYDYDVVLLGATGFTGRLTADAARAAGPARAAVGDRRPRPGVGWSRSPPSSPRRVRPVPASGCLIADVADAASLRALAEQTSVVATTVGPFMELGAEVVAACAETGTDYVDITGEPEFVDRIVARAPRAGAANRCQARACLRVRLDPVRPGSAVHRASASRRRPDPVVRLRPSLRHVLRRHVPLRDQGVLPGTPVVGGRRPAAAGRARRTHADRASRSCAATPTGAFARRPWLGAAAADARPGRRAAVCARAA